MARPLKQGIDYFPLDANFFEKKSTKALMKKHGLTGLYLLQKITCQGALDNGYYMQFDDDYMELLCDDLDTDPSEIESIFDYLTDKKRRLLTEVNHPLLGRVFTSEQLQKDYQVVAVERVTGRNKKNTDNKDKRDIVDGLIWQLSEHLTNDEAIHVIEGGIFPPGYHNYSTEKPRNNNGIMIEEPRNLSESLNRDSQSVEKTSYTSDFRSYTIGEGSLRGEPITVTSTTSTGLYPSINDVIGFFHDNNLDFKEETNIAKRFLSEDEYSKGSDWEKEIDRFLREKRYYALYKENNIKKDVKP